MSKIWGVDMVVTPAAQNHIKKHYEMHYSDYIGSSFISSCLPLVNVQYTYSSCKLSCWSTPGHYYYKKHHINQYTRLFFWPFSKNSRPKKLKVKKTQNQRLDLTFWRFSRLQPKNSKEKIVRRKIFNWVDALNVIFMGMFVDFCNIYALLCAC